MSSRLLMGVLLTLIIFTSTGRADDFDGQSPRGPIYDITHFDVIPLVLPGPPPVDFLQSGYRDLFHYRDASAGDTGLLSFKVVNLLFPEENHSEIVDVWDNLQDYKSHLAQPHSVDFRFSVMGAYGTCCIGSPIDDRQYSLVQFFNAPWTSKLIPSVIGSGGPFYSITYVDFLQDGNVAVGNALLLKYAETTGRSNQPHNLSYSVLRQIDRPNRFAILEVWDTQANYNTWQSSITTTSFTAQIKVFLGSPFDIRPAVLCGETYVDNTGCVAP